MKPAGLLDFLGCEARLVPLKSRGLRLRNHLKPWLIRQPRRAISYRVEAADGRVFKLLIFSRWTLEKRRHVEEKLRSLASLSCVPSLVWGDTTHLLVEWVQGRSPEMGDPEFARSLGAALAALHAVGRREAPRAEVVDRALEQAESLVSLSHLEVSALQGLGGRLDSELPDRVVTAMVCGDPTLANFLLDDRGGLHLIDPGSLQPGLPVDVYLVGSELWQGVDRAALQVAYREAGGDDFTFRYEGALRLLHHVRKCALDAELLARTSAFERGRRSNLERKLARNLEELRRIAG